MRYKAKLSEVLIKSNDTWLTKYNGIALNWDFTQLRDGEALYYQEVNYKYKSINRHKILLGYFPNYERRRI